MKEAVPVTNGDKLSEGLEDKEAIGNLCKKSSELTTDDCNYGWTKTKEEINNTVLEDTVGETFAKNIGNKTYKPEKWNEIDEALKDSEVYVIKKDSFLGNIIKSIKGMFGEGKDMKNLQEVFDESFKVKVENLSDRKED